MPFDSTHQPGTIKHQVCQGQESGSRLSGTIGAWRGVENLNLGKLKGDVGNQRIEGRRRGGVGVGWPQKGKDEKHGCVGGRFSLCGSVDAGAARQRSSIWSTASLNSASKPTFCFRYHPIASFISSRTMGRKMMGRLI